MTWTYSQSTGDLHRDGEFQGTGYSGTGNGRNNPEMQTVAGIGPLPRGLYDIGAAYQHPHLGPCVMNLEPTSDTMTFGRSAFRIHGDNKAHDASHGCVILGPAIRHMVADSSDTKLEVVA